MEPRGEKLLRKMVKEKREIAAKFFMYFWRKEKDRTLSTVR